MLLSVEHLMVRYRNGARGVSDVSFTVDDGQVVALFGPNGAGKTTSVRAVSGFLKSEGVRTAGRVLLRGTSVAGLEPHRLASMGVGLVPERGKVFGNLGVGENLAVARSRARGSAPDLAEILTLFPALADRLGEKAGRLSGGQQQMLALAMALSGRPRLLIIDELTLGLHHSLQPALFDTVRTIAAQGTAVLLVEESTALALRLADYCYLLGGGQIRDEGPAERFVGNDLLAAGYVEA
jgi:branched-chain amino acid transport system ATP-binding protein